MNSRTERWWRRISVSARLQRLEKALMSLNASVETLSHEARRLETAQAGLDERLASLQSTVDRLDEHMRKLQVNSAASRSDPSVPSVAAVSDDYPRDVIAEIDTLRREIGRLSRFVLKVADGRLPGPTGTTDAPPRLEHPLPIEAQFERLEAIVPRTYGLWHELLHVNLRSYAGFPVHSCSVNGHPSAAMFTSFVRQYLRGYVLDIGCGPQPVPLYLQQYPSDHIYGIDPMSSPAEHPFQFYRGLAEFLPWNDRSFDVVIAATSLDHMLLLNRTMREIHRVMKADGEFLVWVAFVAGSAPYDPCSPDIEPVDQYHLFHFTEDFFEATLTGLFAVSDKLRLNLEIDHHFYRLRKLPLDAASSPADDVEAAPA
jgi:SAM-dependent methyltransferase